MPELDFAAAQVTSELDRDFDSSSRRLFHGRGHTYGDLNYLNIDWYKPLLLITLYREVDKIEWDCFVEKLAATRPNVECAIVQHRYNRGAPTDNLWGEVPPDLYAREHGLNYCLSIGEKQNIGFFLDMEPGRLWLNNRANDRRILNLFSYTCSFSVAAINGGAKSVMNVDMSRAALNVGRENHRINNHDIQLKRDIQFLPHNLFRSWKKIANHGPYDIVVIDPPSRQKGSFVADKDYARVLRRIPSLMVENGELLICLNAPELGEDFLVNLMANELPDARLVERLANRKDFPEANSQRNLKMLHYRL